MKGQIEECVITCLVRAYCNCSRRCSLFSKLICSFFGDMGRGARRLVGMVSTTGGRLSITGSSNDHGAAYYIDSQGNITHFFTFMLLELCT